MNSIDLDDKEVALIRENIKQLNCIFLQLERSGISKEKLGYYMSEDSTLYFSSYCLSPNGHYYLDASECNYNDLLSKDDVTNMYSCIINLLSLNIINGGYNTIFGNYVYSIKDEYYERGYTRYYMLMQEPMHPKVLEGKSYYKIYDVKDSLFLVGDKYIP